MKKQSLNMRYCLDCSQELIGRSDKKFCDDQCRINYHNSINQEQNRIFRKIHSILKRNWKILKEAAASGQTEFMKEELINRGFNFKYSTQQILENQNTAFYCYDLGYVEIRAGVIQFVHDAFW